MELKKKEYFLKGYIKAFENMSFGINFVPLYECSVFEFNAYIDIDDLLIKSIYPNSYKDLALLDNWKKNLKETIKNKIDSRLLGGKTKDKSLFYSDSYMHYWNGLYGVLTETSENLKVWSLCLSGQDYMLSSVEAYAFKYETYLILLSFDETD